MVPKSTLLDFKIPIGLPVKTCDQSQLYGGFGKCRQRTFIDRPGFMGCMDRSCLGGCGAYFAGHRIGSIPVPYLFHTCSIPYGPNPLETAALLHPYGSNPPGCVCVDEGLGGGIFTLAAIWWLVSFLFCYRQVFGHSGTDRIPKPSRRDPVLFTGAWRLDGARLGSQT